MRFFSWQNILISLAVASLIIAGGFFALSVSEHVIAPTAAVSIDIKNNESVYVPPQKLNNPPEIVKAIYVTGYSAGSSKYLDYLTELFKNTEINSVVVDIKGSGGEVSYKSGAADVKKYDLYNGAIRDIDALINFFHDQNIYVIGRISVFEDPLYSSARPEISVYNKTNTTDLSKPVLWRDRNKLSWLDPASKEGWSYTVSLAKDALYHGFDEINFDYIRFPSDGDMDALGFPVWNGTTPKATIIRQFFDYMRQELAGEKLSADLFGQTTVNKDDMGIGQLLENAFETFDYISPMVYPSHYIDGFIGFENPAEHPYEITKYSMDSAFARKTAYTEFLLAASNAGKIVEDKPKTLEKPLAKFRPWLQDFDMGAEYTANMIKDEIKATQDSLGAEYSGYMLWNPRNIYTEEAVLKVK